MLALGEACSGIEERFFGYIVSDDEELDAEENMDNQGAGSEDVQKVVPGQMRTLFLALATCMSDSNTPGETCADMGETPSK
jgi:hypothetical protein